MLYRLTDRRYRRDVPVMGLTYNASFDADGKDAPSKSGIKHLDCRFLTCTHV